MKKNKCISIDSDNLEELSNKKSNGVTQTWIVNEALRQYFGLKNTEKIYLELPQEIMSLLRGKCIESQKTINDIANELIKKGLTDASSGQASSS